MSDFGYNTDPTEIIDPHFTGCLSNLRINGRPYPIRMDQGWTGWAIEDCDGTACGAEICQHDGTCNVNDEAADGYSCECKSDFSGRNCEEHTLCLGGGGCQNGAECAVENGAIKCHCPLGFSGAKCEEGTGLNWTFLWTKMTFLFLSN